MSAPKHTGVEWRVGEYDRSGADFGSISVFAILGDGTEFRSVARAFCDESSDRPEYEANARLIAAAPDGLDFAKALDALWVQIIPHGPGDPGEPRIFDAETLAVWRQCRAFIAKAAGEGAS